MVRNNDNGLVPVMIMQQPILYSAFTSLGDVGDNMSTGRQLSYALHTDDVGNDQTTTTMTMTSSCRSLMLKHPLILLSLTSPLGA